MLGKLLKHEFKATGRILPFGYLVMALFFLISFAAKSMLSQFGSVYQLPIILYILSIITVMILTFILLIIRFYKSMYGNEGYLTQTLPVGKGQLLATKFIASAVWITLNLVVTVVALAGAFYLFDVNVGEVWNQITMYLSAMPLYTAFGIVTMVLQVFLFIAAVYFAITLANTSKFLKNNIAFSFVFYILIAFIISTLEVIAMLFIPLSIEFAADGTMHFVFQNMLSTLDAMFAQPDMMPTMGVASVFVDAIGVVTFVALTNRLMKTKINVK